MPALHAKTPLLVVANARHSPRYGCALRLDQRRFDAPCGHGQKTLSLCAAACSVQPSQDQLPMLLRTTRSA
jgi:hypothetical protein